MHNKPHTEETKRKISNSKKGKPSWNKGISMKEKSKQKLSISLKGHIPWNKGKHLEYMIGNTFGFKKGQKAWNKGKKLPQFSGKRNPNWRGGKHIYNTGYVFIFKPKHPFACNGYVYEHRLIIEKIIGRHLLPKEKCHHLGAKNDNRPNMLMTFISQSAHIRFHCNPQNVKPEEIIFDGRKFINNK